MFTAICRRKCAFGGRLWRPGEKYAGEAAPPHHFEIIEPEEKKKAGKKEKDSA